MSIFFGILGVLVGIGALFCIFFIVCNCLIFRKLGEPAWAAIIPFYNTYILYRAVWSAPYGIAVIALAIVISGISLLDGVFVTVICGILGIVLMVLSVICTLKLLAALGKPWPFIFGVLFLPIIFYPILAFSK